MCLIDGLAAGYPLGSLSRTTHLTSPHAIKWVRASEQIAIAALTALPMTFSTRDLLISTALVAGHIALRSWWTSVGIPARGALIPLSLAAAVAVYFGWTCRSVLGAAVFAGGAAALSSSSIAAEVILGSRATSFLRADAIDAHYYADPALNALAISVITAAAVIGSAPLTYVSGLLHSVLADRRVNAGKGGGSASVWIAATVGTMILVLSLLISTRPRLSDANGARIRTGMHRQQVEAVVGPPNPLADSRHEPFWDNYTHWGRRYVSLYVVYDGTGRVERLSRGGFWKTRRWLFW